MKTYAKTEMCKQLFYIIFNSQTWKQTKCLLIMDEYKNCVISMSSILFNDKKGTADTITNMKKAQKQYAK